MTLHYTHELKIDLPDQLKDKTHHIFALADDGPSDFNFLISRYPLGDGETHMSYGDRMLKELQRTLPQFQTLGRRDIVVAGTPALQLEYRWVNQGEALRQIQTALFLDGTEGQRYVLQLTATFLSAGHGQWDATLQNMLASVRLRPTAAQAVGSSMSSGI